MQKLRFFLCCLLCLGGLAVLFWVIPVRVLSVGETGPFRKVSEGDTFTLRYIHSMYGVEVRETFRIGQEDFKLYHVDSSEAALEYFGIEHSGPNNVQRTLQAFTVPRESMGNHELLMHQSRIRLHAECGSQDPTTVRVTKMNLLTYLMHTLWR